jgi:hypothetical protein
VNEKIRLVRLDFPGNCPFKIFGDMERGRQGSEKSQFLKSSRRLANTRLNATLVSMDKNNSLVLEDWKNQSGIHFAHTKARNPFKR